MPIDYSLLGTERVFDKNYELGNKKTAYTGEPIVKVKDYHILRFKSGFVKPNTDFTIKWSDKEISQGVVGDDYPILGKFMWNNKLYNLVSFPLNSTSKTIDSSQRGVAIDEAGKCIGIETRNGIGTLIRNENICHPKDIEFKTVESERVNRKLGYVNYEIIYSGTNGNQINAIYREYTNEDLARPAFFQDLLYSADSSSVRFRNTKIEIHEVDNEKIVYTVLEDRLSESK